MPSCVLLIHNSLSLLIWGTNLPSSNRGTPDKILQAPQPSIPHHNSISVCATTSSQGVLYMHAMRPSLLSSHAEAMICFPQQPVTLSSSLLWFGSNPTTQHHVGRTFLTRSSPLAAFLPRWAVLSPSSSHVAGRAAPTCSIPLPIPLQGRLSLVTPHVPSSRKRLWLPPHFKPCPDSPHSVAVGSNSWKQFLLFTILIWMLLPHSLNVDFGPSSSPSPH